MAGDRKPAKSRKRAAPAGEDPLVSETRKDGPANDTKTKTADKAEPTTSEPKDDPGQLKQSDPQKTPFTPETLDSTVIAIPLLKELNEDKKKLQKRPTLKPKLFDVIIDLNLE